MLIVEYEPYMAEAIRDGLRREAIAADYLTKPFKLQELHEQCSPRGLVLTVGNTGEKLTPRLVFTLGEQFPRGTSRA